jgi:hypothetical protein
MQSREVNSLMALDPQDLPGESVLFVETQVWGPIDMTDIKEFRVPQGRDDLVKILSISGLPVYSYDRDSLGKDPAYVPANQVGVQPETLLFKGDPVLLEKYERERLQRLSAASNISTYSHSEHH